MSLTIRKAGIMRGFNKFKLIILDILTSLYVKYNNTIEINQYDEIISLGFNCSLAYNINRVNGFVESHLFNWAYIQNKSDFLNVLKNPDIIFSGEYDYKKEWNMFECLNSHIVFHGQSKVKKIQNKNEKIYEENIKNEYNELISRTKHLIEKFKATLNSNEKKLFILVVNPFDQSSITDNIEFLNNTYKILEQQTTNFDLLVICLKDMYSLIENKINPAIILKKVNKIAPIGDAVNPSKTDIWNFNIILKQYCPKIYKKSNKKYKYQEKDT